MERLTEVCWGNLDPWEMCRQDHFCTRSCHDLGGCTGGCIVPNLYRRLATYEDVMPLEQVQELAQAEKDGRLVVLPCKVGDTVYTIEEDYLNCVECKYRDRAYYQEKIRRVSCDMDNGIRCPIYVKEHKVSGFEITFDKDGTAVLSSPREFGYKGLERFSGIDGKVYYTLEEAEAALKEREGAK